MQQPQPPTNLLSLFEIGWNVGICPLGRGHSRLPTHLPLNRYETRPAYQQHQQYQQRDGCRALKAAVGAVQIQSPCSLSELSGQWAYCPVFLGYLKTKISYDDWIHCIVHFPERTCQCSRVCKLPVNIKYSLAKFEMAMRQVLTSIRIAYIETSFKKLEAVIARWFLVF